MNLSDYFINKSVAIVGNADSLFHNEKYGELIDSYDTVCRFNLGWKIKDKNYQGEKTTILFNNGLRLFFPDAKDRNMTTVLASNVMDETINLVTYILPEESKIEIKKLINNKRPSCGMLVMHYISKLNTKNVALFGFDWKKTKSYYHLHPHRIKNKGKGPHDWDAERKYATEVLLKKNNWKLL